MSIAEPTPVTAAVDLSKTGGFDAEGIWHDSYGRFARKGWSGLKHAALQALRGRLAAETARANPDGADLHVRPDSPLHERLGDGPLRAVWHDLDHASVRGPNGRNILVRWTEFLDPVGDRNDMSGGPDGRLEAPVRPVADRLVDTAEAGIEARADRHAARPARELVAGPNGGTGGDPRWRAYRDAFDDGSIFTGYTDAKITRSHLAKHDVAKTLHEGWTGFVNESVGTRGFHRLAAKTFDRDPSPLDSLPLLPGRKPGDDDAAAFVGKFRKVGENAAVDARLAGNTPPEFTEPDETVVAGFLKNLYDHTQKYLADLGFEPDDRVVLHRGLGGHAYRQWNDAGRPDHLDSLPLSAFAADTEFAAKYGDKESGGVVDVEVRAGDILAVGVLNWPGEVVTLAPADGEGVHVTGYHEPGIVEEFAAEYPNRAAWDAAAPDGHRSSVVVDRLAGDPSTGRLRVFGSAEKGMLAWRLNNGATADRRLGENGTFIHDLPVTDHESFSNPSAGYRLAAEQHAWQVLGDIMFPPGDTNDLVVAPGRDVREYVTGPVERWAEKLGVIEDTGRTFDPKAVVQATFGRISSRRWIEDTLTSDNPDPLAVEALRAVHRAAVDELGDQPHAFSRTTDTPHDPFAPALLGMALGNRGPDEASRVVSWYRTDSGLPAERRTRFTGDTVDRTFTADQVLANVGDQDHLGEYLIAESPEVIDRLMRGEFPIARPKADRNDMAARPDATPADYVDPTGGPDPTRFRFRAGDKVTNLDLIPPGVRFRQADGHEWTRVDQGMTFGVDADGNQATSWFLYGLRDADGNDLPGPRRSQWFTLIDDVADPTPTAPEWWLHLGPDPSKTFDWDAHKLLSETNPDEAARLYADNKRTAKQWKLNVERALSMNLLTPEQVDDLYQPGGIQFGNRWYANTLASHHGASSDGGWEALPDKLYHVTSNVPAVRQTGRLLSRSEVADPAGLGGGSDVTVSYTADLGIAQGIADAIHEAVDVAAGRITVEDMVEQARRGDNAPRPFLDEFLSYWKGSVDQPLPLAVTNAFPGGPDDTPDGRLDIYKWFASTRQRVGGKMDPLIFGTSAANLAAVDHANIGIVESEPAVPGARGVQLHSLGEWRTVTSDATRITGYLDHPYTPPERPAVAAVAADVNDLVDLGVTPAPPAARRDLSFVSDTSLPWQHRVERLAAERDLLAAELGDPDQWFHLPDPATLRRVWDADAAGQPLDPATAQALDRIEKIEAYGEALTTLVAERSAEHGGGKPPRLYTPEAAQQILDALESFSPGSTAATVERANFTGGGAVGYWKGPGGNDADGGPLEAWPQVVDGIRDGTTEVLIKANEVVMYGRTPDGRPVRAVIHKRNYGGDWGGGYSETLPSGRRVYRQDDFGHLTVSLPNLERRGFGFDPEAWTRGNGNFAETKKAIKAALDRSKKDSFDDLTNPPTLRAWIDTMEAMGVDMSTSPDIPVTEGKGPEGKRTIQQYGVEVEYRISRDYEEVAKLPTTPLGKLKASTAAAKTFKVGLAPYPRSWTDLLPHQHLDISTATGTNAGNAYNGVLPNGGSYVRTASVVGAPQHASAVAHEFGHSMQRNVPGVHLAETWHMMKRLRAHPGQQRGTVSGRRGDGFSDHFADDYSGRFYMPALERGATEPTADGEMLPTVRAFELFTTGVQSLYTTAKARRQLGDDPELTNFTLGLMSLVRDPQAPPAVAPDPYEPEPITLGDINDMVTRPHFADIAPDGVLYRAVDPARDYTQAGAPGAVYFTGHRDYASNYGDHVITTPVPDRGRVLDVRDDTDRRRVLDAARAILAETEQRLPDSGPVYRDARPFLVDAHKRLDGDGTVSDLAVGLANLSTVINAVENPDHLYRPGTAQRAIMDRLDVDAMTDIESDGLDNIDAPGAVSFAFRTPPAVGDRNDRVAVRFDGMRPADGETHAHGVKIPPAWTDVHVSDRPEGVNGMIARGVDAAGRSQRLYSAEHTERQAAAKFARLQAFAAHLDRLDDSLRRDALTDDDAGALAVIRALGIRPGSTADTKAKTQAYGATTLLTRHVTVDGDHTVLDFTGKKGVHLRLESDDPWVAQVFAAHLADSTGPDDPVFDTDPVKVNRYLDEHTAPEFKVKDLRTVRANVIAASMVAARPEPPANERERRRWVNEVADAVAAQLGNTRAVALASYINPVVFGPWQPGDTAADLEPGDVFTVGGIKIRKTADGYVDDATGLPVHPDGTPA